MITIKKNDANIHTYSINLIESYEHQVYVLGKSWDKKDILYIKSFSEDDYNNILQYLSCFSFEKYEMLTRRERKEIFEDFTKILMNFIHDSNCLIEKHIELMIEKK